jgi:hypothetical protein
VDQRGFSASSIRVMESSAKRFVGSLVRLESGTSRWSMKLTNTDYGMPRHLVPAVVLGSGAKLIGPSGEAKGATDWFAELQSSTAIEVEGSYDATANRITAIWARHLSPSARVQRKLVGSAVISDKKRSEAKLSVTGVDGRTLAQPTVVEIVFGQAVQYQNEKGEKVSREAWLEGFEDGASMVAEGTLSSTGTMSAVRVRRAP